MNEYRRTSQLFYEQKFFHAKAAMNAAIRRDDKPAVLEHALALAAVVEQQERNGFPVGEGG